MARHLSRDAFPALMVLAAFGLAGCSRLPDSTYALRADAEKLELPAKHKSQIASYLAMFHGTPANPRMAVPDEEAVEQSAEIYGAGDDDPPAAGRPADGVYRIAGGDSAGFDRLHLQLGPAGQVAAVMHRLGAVGTVFLASAGLDAQQRGQLHPVAGVGLPVHRLGPPEQVQQRQFQQLLNFGTAPVVADVHAVGAMPPKRRERPW